MALVIMVIDLRVPYIAGKFLCSCTTGGFSRTAQFHEVSAMRVGCEDGVGSGSCPMADSDISGAVSSSSATR
jgi:hypothetical protein